MAIACGFTANTAMAADGNSRGHKSENVAAFARQKYRGCRILDRDTDNGFIELKIRHKNIEKILLFSPSGQWLRTLWDIRREQLPEGVVSGLRSAGFGFRDIDDNDNQAVESPKGRFYAIQARASGHDRIYLVNRRGKVLRSFTDDEWNDGRFPDDRKHHGWDDVKTTSTKAMTSGMTTEEDTAAKMTVRTTSTKATTSGMTTEEYTAAKMTAKTTLTRAMTSGMTDTHPYNEYRENGTFLQMRKRLAHHHQ